MSAPRPVAVATEADGIATARFAEAEWLRAARLLTADRTPLELRIGEDEEAFALVLSGTHDLEANSGSWVSRGVRATPFDGRPVALYLPPKTRFRTSGGQGQLVVASVRRPTPPPAPAAEATEAAAAKPLLPLAGSNKAFDSATGSWRPIESFPDSPEAILPRRIEQHTAGGCRAERVFPPAYKAFGLTLLEAVLEPGAALALPAYGEAPLSEWAVVLRTEGTARVGDAECDADAVLWGRDAATLTACAGRCHAVVIGAGPKA